MDPPQVLGQGLPVLEIRPRGGGAPEEQGEEEGQASQREGEEAEGTLA